MMWENFKFPEIKTPDRKYDRLTANLLKYDMEKFMMLCKKKNARPSAVARAVLTEFIRNYKEQGVPEGLEEEGGGD